MCTELEIIKSQGGLEGLSNEDIKTLAEGFILSSEIGGDSDVRERFEKIKKEYTVKQLKAIIKEAGITGYSRLREDDLIQIVIDNNLL